MTAPMTPERLRDLRFAIERAKLDADRGDLHPDDDINHVVGLELLEETDRLRALPVLRTCGVCGWHLDDRGGRDCVYPGRRWVVGTPDNSVPPPSWCPLRGGAR